MGTCLGAEALPKAPPACCLLASPSLNHLHVCCLPPALLLGLPETAGGLLRFPSLTFVPAFSTAWWPASPTAYRGKNMTRLASLYPQNGS